MSALSDLIAEMFGTRTVSLRGGAKRKARRDPATRLAAGGRILYLDEAAQQIRVKPRWLCGRTHIKDPRTGREKRLPKEIIVSTAGLVVEHRAAGWLPGRLTLAGVPDPWRWIAPGRDVAVSWWLSKRRGDRAFTLRRRLDWAARMAARPNRGPW